MGKRPPRKPPALPDTKATLLDVAERLFAEHGYDGVGLRAIAAEARVNLNAVNYHFTSKENLYIETFFRRFLPAHDQRMSSLRDAQIAARGRPLKVELIVDCLIRAPLTTVLTHPHFAVLLARNLFIPPPFLQTVLKPVVEPSIIDFTQAFAAALPRHPLPLIMAREMFGMGAILMVVAHSALLKSQRIPLELVIQDAVTFISAGMKSPAKLPGKPAL